MHGRLTTINIVNVCVDGINNYTMIMWLLEILSLSLELPDVLP